MEKPYNQMCIRDREKAAASKGEKEESSEDYVSYKEKKNLERASRIIENEK